MTGTNVFSVQKERLELYSEFLSRTVKIDFYFPGNFKHQYPCSFLIVNDGQDLEMMEFDLILEELKDQLKPVIVAAIHCGSNRKMEYGVIGEPDFKGRGALAMDYADFLFNELLPVATKKFHLNPSMEKSIAGFSLGGLSALDIAWSFPGEYKYAAVFSGSLWWRSIDQSDNDYDDDKHRIMHQHIRRGKLLPGLKFFFQCGNKDETRDRNRNGIIDSIDDTKDLINELVQYSSVCGARQSIS